MEVDFYDWRAWIILIIVLLIVLWIYIKVSGDVTSSRTRSRTQERTDRRSPRVVTHTATRQVTTRMPVITSVTRDEAREHDMVQPHKSQSAGERECAKVFRELYGDDVVVQTRRCKWLINPLTGRALELDVFAPNAMVACEYDGIQHRKIVPRFHPLGQKSFEYQQWKDAYKDAACVHQGVHLIRVPDTVHIAQIRDYILERLPAGR